MGAELTGVLSAARLALAIKHFREERPNYEILGADPIAIVGIGCRFPGNVRSAEECWRVLADGIDVVTEVPEDRWPANEYFDSDPAVLGKTNGRWGGFVSDVDRFDPVLFGISPREAANMDPQQRLLLEVAWEAIQDSGRAPSSLAGSRTGVFVGISQGDYERLAFEDNLAINANSCTGAYRSIAGGRISYLLDLRGPSVCIDTACSSSLVAIHSACGSLRSMECDCALAGGVGLHLLPEHYIGLARAGMLSPDGRCKSFDARADGYVPSEGCGLVVVKRLSDALADGDRIYAVIRGSAINQDGRTNSLTAPSGLAQQEVVLAALRNGRVPPSSISYVETHGTGTPLGDPIEVEALAAVLGAPEQGASPCFLGAAKSNFGHLESAAGVAGLIKAVLALHKEEIPANLHFEKLNPHISLEGTRFCIPQQTVAWPRGEARRFAGVSSFGFSGTNAHVVLEEAPRLTGRTNRAPEGACLLLLSAKTPEALQDSVRDYRMFLISAGSKIPLYDICHSLALRRDHHEERVAFTAETHAEMCRLMDEFLSGSRSSEIAYGRASAKGESLVFVCSGQGSQWPGMGSSLLREEPIFKAAIEECEASIRHWAGWSLIERLSASAPESKLAETEFAQPAIFAIEVALARLFESWGVKPAAVIGHSLGEVPAAHIAGVLSLDEGVRVVVHRGRLMQAATGRGKMAVVRLPADAVLTEVAGYFGKVSVAANNSPQSTVISGDSEAVDELVRLFRAREARCVLLPVNYAFHSAQMQPYSEELVRALGGVETHTEQIPILSTVFGRKTAGHEFNAAYWGQNVRKAVEFRSTVEAAGAMGLATFLEIGPHPVLSGSLEECTKSSAIPTLRSGEDERTSLLSALGALYIAGHPISWEAVYRHPAAPVSLPPYPYQRKRFCIERRANATKTQLHPLVGKRLRSPAIHGAIFESEIGTTSLAYLAGHLIQGSVLLPMAAMLEMVRHAGLLAFGTVRALVDVTVLESLTLSQDAPATVQIVIEEDRFQVFSLLGEEWKLHARGRTAESAGDRLPTPDVPPALESPGPLYAHLREQGALFGEAFQTVRALQAGDREAWSRIRLGDSEKREVASYCMHPALLDGCLQTAIAAVGESAALFLPFAVDRFECFAKAGVEVHAHAKLRPAASPDVLSADIDVYGKDGTPVARVSGLHFKCAMPGERAGNIYEVVWQLTDRHPVSKSATGLWAVVGDDAKCVGKLVTALKNLGVTVKAADRDNIPDASGVIWLAGETRELVSLAQELARRGGAAPRLWLVTRSAIAPGAADAETEACEGRGQWSIRGLARSLAMEHPKMGCVQVDLDPAASDFEALAAEIDGWDGEEEIAYRAGRRFVPRLKIGLTPNAEPQRWTIPVRGSVENLALDRLERRVPGPDEVEVQVETSALNFRDVLNVLGLYPGDAGNPGAEFCGSVVRTGEGVSEYRVGDQVMGIAWGSFASFVTTPEALIAPVPEGWSTAEGSASPNVFLTAFHCLLHIGRLRRGERVLIHAAAGGVGLAAVQLAAHLGAEIFVTAGNPQKRDYLRSLGLLHVFDSRTLAFREQIAEVTSGQGVDLVLNCLAGDHIDASFSVLSAGGRFVEIGKNKIWSREQVETLGKRIEYFIVDVAEQIEFDRPLVKAHLRNICKLIEAGALRPLPVRVFRFEDAPAAFRYMAQARHIGKIVLRHPLPARIRADATYLITGGLGSIGLRSAEWLVQRGARHLMLVGRRGPAAAAAIEALRQAGAHVEIRTADVSRKEEIDAVLSEIKLQMPRLAGVLHAAGVLDDGIFIDQTWDRIKKVMAPKVLGAWNLHELTRGMPLDFFVLFSSVASLTGSPGQSGYAAANAFLDRLAHYRRARGLAALSVNWGAWAESGMAARAAETGGRPALPGVRQMKAQRCFAMLENALAQTAPQVAIVDADWSRWNPMPRLLSTLVHKPAPAIATSGSDILSSLTAASASTRRKILVDFLRGQVKSLLGLNGTSLYIDEAQPLLRLGMDSLTALEFRTVLATALNRPLSATLVFDHPTIGDLADFLNTGSASKDSAPRRDALLEELETLSDADAEELLKLELDLI
jgi:acyl transferase domain-containing protein